MATTDTDALLIRQLRARDAGAWHQLIERFEGRLLAFVDSRLRGKELSERFDETRKCLDLRKVTETVQFDQLSMRDRCGR